MTLHGLEAVRAAHPEAAEGRLSELASSLESTRSELTAKRRRTASLEQDLRAAGAETSRERKARLRAEERAGALESKIETMRAPIPHASGNRAPAAKPRAL